MNLRLAICGLVVAILPCALRAAERITYDSQCLTIDGHDVLIYSGAFHYFRCPKDLWRDRFRRMKQAGLNAVETYVPWNWHERSEPSDLNDFSKIDMTNLDDWLKMAEDEFGFYVILRPGPYICAEWDGGGFPQWLTKYRPAAVSTPYWLRSDEEKYLAWCAHWYRAVSRAAIPHLLTHREPGKGGVILWQIENEYDFAGMPQDASLGQLRMLAHASRDHGIDVPLITCMSRRYAYRDDPFLRDNVIETLTSYPDFNAARLTGAIESLAKYQPEKFRAIIELQGGWFTSLGERQRRPGGYTAAQIQHVAIASLERGVTAINFYMFFGGTNFADYAPRSITTTYDYQAPIHEPGGVGDRWRSAAAVGKMIRDHEQQLVRSKPVGIQVLDNPHQDVSIAMRQAADGARFVFVRNTTEREPRSGKATIRAAGSDASIDLTYDLEPFGAKVLYFPPHQDEGSWLPDPSSIAMPTRPSAEQLPAPVKITEAKRRIEPFPPDALWQSMRQGQTLEDLGVLDCRFIYYRLPLPAEARSDPRQWGLSIKLPPGDGLLAQMDGQIIASDVSSDDGETSIRLGDGPSNVASGAGGGQLVLMYENAGHPHSGSGGMERRKGVGEVRIKPAKSLARNIDGWRALPVDSMTNRPEVKVEYDDANWKPVNVSGERSFDLAQGEMAVVRATFQTTTESKERGPLHLVLGPVDDTSIVYLNGEKIGETHDWRKAHRFDITNKVRTGRNVIAIVVANTDGPGGISRGVKFEPQSSEGQLLPLSQVALSSVAMRDRWFDAALDDSSWESTRLGPHAIEDQKGLVTWYRLHFVLPEAREKVWAPWRIHLEATGNGFLYINGHALGRYWQKGPQRDFFLPECWLKFGNESPNVLTMSLRPVGESTELRSAEVGVYADQAELRE